jgi:predicted amidophosphoribosyltransferase
MRDRHIPRLCRSCTAPMARQQHACWRCGAEWTATAPSRPPAGPIAAALLQAEVEARVSAQRWIDEGGTYSEPPARRVAAAVEYAR